MKVTTAIRSLLSVVFLATAPSVLGQLSVSAFSTPYTINFDGSLSGVNFGAFQGNGFEATPSTFGTLDADAWQVLGLSDGSVNFGVDNFSNDATRGPSNGGVVTGGIYGFATGSITGRALGFEPSGSDLTPGSITLRITNNTGAAIPQLQVQYEIHVRNDFPRSNYVNFAHSPDNASYWSEPSLDYASPLAATPGGFVLAASQSITLGCVNIPAGSDYFLRWELGDNGGSSNRDEFAIDNIQITAVNTASVTYYSRNSGDQTTNAGTTTQLWATTPGGVGATQFPLQRCADYVVQSGDVVTLSGSGNTGLTINNLTVENGGSLVANGATNRYLNVLGNITCNGNIGGAANGMSFNMEHGNQTISGTGTFDGGRIRKSNVNGMNATTNLLIDMDLNLHHAGTGIYNDRSAGASLFNVTIAAGRTVGVYRLAIDGQSASSGAEAGGHVQVDGNLNVTDLTYLNTNNSTNPVSLTISATGYMSTGSDCFPEPKR